MSCKTMSYSLLVTEIYFIFIVFHYLIIRKIRKIIRKKITKMNNSTPKTPRKKLNELKLEQKYEIIRYHNNHLHLTQASLDFHFEKEWHLDFKISKSTMSDILSKTAKKIQMVTSVLFLL